MLEPGLQLLPGRPETRPNAELHVMGRRDRSRHGVGAGVQHEAVAIHRPDVRVDGARRPLEVGCGSRFAAGLDLPHPSLGSVRRPRDRDVAHAIPIVMPLRCVKPSRAPSIEYSDPRPLCFLPP